MVTHKTCEIVNMIAGGAYMAQCDGFTAFNHSGLWFNWQTETNYFITKHYEQVKTIINLGMGQKRKPISRIERDYSEFFLELARMG